MATGLETHRRTESMGDGVRKRKSREGPGPAIISGQQESAPAPTPCTLEPGPGACDTALFCGSFRKGVRAALEKGSGPNSAKHPSGHLAALEKGSGPNSAEHPAGHLAIGS